jgi:hypothetical protein
VAQSPIPGELGDAEEVVSLRTRDAKHFRKPDGRNVALIGHNLHYEAAPGVWHDVDLSFRPDGVDQVADRTSVIVRVRDVGVEALDRSTGKGIRWLTPSRPTVAEGHARFADQGLEWQYTPAPAASSSPHRSLPPAGQGRTRSSTSSSAEPRTFRWTRRGVW